MITIGSVEVLPTLEDDGMIILEELLAAFNNAEAEGCDEMVLRSKIGSRFHQRVLRLYEATLERTVKVT